MRKARACLVLMVTLLVIALLPGSAIAAQSERPSARLDALKAARNAAGERAAELAPVVAEHKEALAKADALATRARNEVDQAIAQLDAAEHRLSVLQQFAEGVSHGMLTGILTNLLEAPTLEKQEVLALSLEELSDRAATYEAEAEELRDKTEALTAELSEARTEQKRLDDDAVALKALIPDVVEVSPEIVDVGGIEVHRSIANELVGLLWHARADGLDLGGYGHRSTERQIELRRQNGCPNIYTSSPSACRIPTARPGTSNHETGLAIDFTINGDTVCFPRSAARCPTTNPAFRWLVTHAGSYGLKNLPSEAWHWSTTGT